MVTREAREAYTNILDEARIELALRHHHSRCDVKPELGLSWPGEIGRHVEDAPSHQSGDTESRPGTGYSDIGLTEDDTSEGSSDAISRSESFNETLWSQDEIELFLAAVSRHGKGQPALMSADLGHTKSTGDVVRLLVLLKERTRSSQERNDGDISDDFSSDEDSDAVSCASSQQRAKRLLSSIEAAHEMSQTWITFEEEIAQRTIKSKVKRATEVDQMGAVGASEVDDIERTEVISRHDLDVASSDVKSIKIEAEALHGAETLTKAEGPRYAAYYRNILEARRAGLEEMQAYLDGVRRPLVESEIRRLEKWDQDDIMICASDAMRPPRIHGHDRELDGDVQSDQSCSSSESSVYDDDEQRERVLQRRDVIRGGCQESGRSSRDMSEARDDAEEQRWASVDFSDACRARRSEDSLWERMGIDAQSWRRQRLPFQPKSDDWATPALTQDNTQTDREDIARSSSSSFEAEDETAPAKHDPVTTFGTDWLIDSECPEDRLQVWLENASYSQSTV